MVDGAGQFTLNGVPPGTVTLTFTGNNVSASITLNNVAVGDEIQIEIRLNGTSARVESERRRRGDDDGDDDDDDEDEANEVEGEVSCADRNLPSADVRHRHPPRYNQQCHEVRRPCRASATGCGSKPRDHSATNGTFTATRVEIDD